MTPITPLHGSERALDLDNPPPPLPAPPTPRPAPTFGPTLSQSEIEQYAHAAVKKLDFKGDAVQIRSKQQTLKQLLARRIPSLPPPARGSLHWLVVIRGRIEPGNPDTLQSYDIFWVALDSSGRTLRSGKEKSDQTDLFLDLDRPDPVAPARTPVVQGSIPAYPTPRPPTPRPGTPFPGSNRP